MRQTLIPMVAFTVLVAAACYRELILTISHYMDPLSHRPLMRSCITFSATRIKFVCCAAMLLPMAGHAVAADKPANEMHGKPLGNLFILDIDSGKIRQLTHDNDRECGSPDWSPDGKWIAYDGWKRGQSFSHSVLFVMRADGSERRQIGPGAMPSWSPDGKQLVCHNYKRPQTIEVMNRDGTGREVIIDHWGSPCWSPQGDWIASISPQQRGITLFDMATGKERNILPRRFAIWQGFSVSPDGQRFCFADRSDGLAVATLDATAGVATVKLLLNRGMGSHSSWSPDSKRIVFGWKFETTNNDPFAARDNHPTTTDNDAVQIAGDHDQIYFIDADNPSRPIRAAAQDPNRDNDDPDWSPDGKSVVFSSMPAE